MHATSTDELVLVDDPPAVALDTASRRAVLDPLLVRDIKRAVGIAEDGDFATTVDLESWEQAASTNSPHLADAIARFAK